VSLEIDVSRRPIHVDALEKVIKCHFVGAWPRRKRRNVSAMLPEACWRGPTMAMAFPRTRLLMRRSIFLAAWKRRLLARRKVVFW